VSRTWSDRLGDALRERLGEVEGNRLVDSFARGFPTAYEETFTTSQGVADLAHLDRLSSGQGTSVALYRPSDASPDVRRFKLFRADALSLTDVLPIFTHMGVEVVDEQPYEVTRVDGTPLEVCSRSSSTRRASRACTCASAGRARRPALVRPARGFPHRGAGPGEGAAGQERGHRAGRRQGRLRRQAACRRATARRCRPKASPATAPSSGLLDLTDNLSTASVVPPPRVVPHDGDDPYLVVAADKGTATFSDIANGIAASTASGSATPSPRAARPATTTRMGITARGAWEAVKRHFREMGHDTRPGLHRRRRRRHVGRRVRQRHAAVASKIRLLAAFDHRHIFIDPNPDAAAASPSASACSHCRARPGPTTTRR
jgi:NAD-specific glutamate dehydrogenase